MSTHKAISASSIKNNGGTGFGVRYSSDILNSVDLGLEATRTGSVVIDGDNTDAALSGGVFAYQNAAPVAKRLTDSLAGLSNDFLLSGAGKPDLVDSIHEIEGITTNKTATAIRAGNFNIYTGQFTSAPSVTTDSFGNDNAARVDREDPGTLTYKLGNPTAVTVGYKEKTN